MLSFIVPAHNEQGYLNQTLRAIHECGKAVAQPYEVIVVDDASTDATAELALRNEARVVRVNHRQIAATRNSGGRAAQGERFIFVDADTIANPAAVAAALRWMDRGAVGGGAPAWMDEKEILPLYARVMGWFSVILPKLAGFTGGAFMFCTREAFERTGGFDERLFWAEEVAFTFALKRQGRFVVLWQRVITSGRRLRKTSPLRLLLGALQIVFSPVKSFTQRASVQGVWYDSNRMDDDTMPTSLAARVANGVTLLMLVIVLTQPFWSLVPWSVTPLASGLGKTRFVVGGLLCHAGQVFWPVGFFLLINVLRQRRPTGLWQSGALIAFCFWQAWGASVGLVQFWTRVYNWITT